MAEKFTGEHRYVVGIFSTYDKAVQAVNREYEYRGSGKYPRFWIQEWDIDTYDDKDHKVIDLPGPFD